MLEVLVRLDVQSEAAVDVLKSQIDWFEVPRSPSQIHDCRHEDRALQLRPRNTVAEESTEVEEFETVFILNSPIEHDNQHINKPPGHTDITLLESMSQGEEQRRFL